MAFFINNSNEFAILERIKSTSSFSINNSSEIVFINYLNQIRNNNGELIPAIEVEKMIQNYKPIDINEVRIFKVRKESILELIKTIGEDKIFQFRLVANYGCESSNTNLTIFLTLSEVRSGQSVNKYIECIPSHLVIDTPVNKIDLNYSVKTDNFFRLRLASNQSNNNRRGIAHHINNFYPTQTNIEFGIKDFILSRPGDYFYLFTGLGNVKTGYGLYSQENDFLTIIFSHSDTLSFSETDIYYNKSGTCCPPAY